MSIHLDPETLGSGAMQPVKTPHPVVLPAQAAQPKPSATRRIGRAAGTALVWGLSGGVLSVVGLLAVERLAPIEWRPSSMVGAFAGRKEAALLLTSIEAKRAEIAMQKEEEARAQQEVVALQADNERVTAAYKVLFDRGNLMAQQWATGAKEALLIDMNTRVAALKGKAGVSSTKDTVAMLCDLGKVFSPDIDCGDPLRASAQVDRAAITEEIVANYRAQSLVIAASLQDWSKGLADPAQIVAVKGKIERLYPLPRAPIPAQPIPTASPLSGS